MCVGLRSTPSAFRRWTAENGESRRCPPRPSLRRRFPYASLGLVGRLDLRRFERSLEFGRSGALGREPRHVSAQARLGAGGGVLVDDALGGVTVEQALDTLESRAPGIRRLSLSHLLDRRAQPGAVAAVTVAAAHTLTGALLGGFHIRQRNLAGRWDRVRNNHGTFKGTKISAPAMRGNAFLTGCARGD